MDMSSQLCTLATLVLGICPIMNTGYWWESLKGKRPLGRPRHRWVDNIKMDFTEIRWYGLD
jgi:hypothetical protein